jgi:hypothetical protein
MAHYAFLDENNVVTEVITGVDEDLTQIDVDGNEIGGSTEAWETFYGNMRGQTCKRFSFNTIGGKKRNTTTCFMTEEEGFRKNFAIVGSIYNESIDGFTAPKPNDLYELNEEIGMWELIDPSTPDPDAVIDVEPVFVDTSVRDPNAPTT